ncbi:hypothetical protein THAOC_27492, partial [Thalassiosira oceanica]
VEVPPGGKAVEFATARKKGTMAENVQGDAAVATERTCGICLEESKDPLDLPCGHSFCDGCLNEWRSRYGVEEEMRRKCPICRARIPPSREMVTSLISYRAHKQKLEDINDTSSEVYHAICYALEQAEEKVGVDWDGVTVLEENNDKSTVEMPYHIGRAIGTGDIKSVLRWINANQTEDRANAKSAEWMSMPALAVASLCGCLELMTLLLQLGANINTRDCKGCTAIRRLFTPSELTKEGVSDRVRLLLSWGASFFPGDDHSREVCICEARKFGRHELANLLESELGGRRCEIFNLSLQPELNGKTCVVGEYLPDSNQYKMTLETKCKEVLILRPGNLKRRDRTPQDCGYYVEFKNGRTIRHDFDSSEECRAFVAALNRDETQPVVTEEAEARAEQAAAELLAELGLDDSQSKVSTGSDHVKRPKKKGGKKKRRKQKLAGLAGDLAQDVEELVRECRPTEALDEGRRGPENAPAGRGGRHDAPCKEALDVDERREADVPVLGASRAHPAGDVGHESLDLAWRGYRQGSPSKAPGRDDLRLVLLQQGLELALHSEGRELVDRMKGTQQRTFPAALSELGRARFADVGEDVPHVLHPPQGGRLPPHRQLLRVHLLGGGIVRDRPAHPLGDGRRQDDRHGGRGPGVPSPAANVARGNQNGVPQCRTALLVPRPVGAQQRRHEVGRRVGGAVGLQGPEDVRRHLQGEVVPEDWIRGDSQRLLLGGRRPEPHEARQRPERELGDPQGGLLGGGAVVDEQVAVVVFGRAAALHEGPHEAVAEHPPAPRGRRAGTSAAVPGAVEERPPGTADLLPPAASPPAASTAASSSCGRAARPSEAQRAPRASSLDDAGAKPRHSRTRAEDSSSASSAAAHAAVVAMARGAGGEEAKEEGTGTARAGNASGEACRRWPQQLTARRKGTMAENVHGDAAVFTERTCGICLEDSRDPLDLPCGHLFCDGCLNEWRSRYGVEEEMRRKCPVCRATIPPSREMVTSLHTYRARKKIFEDKGDMTSEHYHNICALLRGAEEKVGADWDGVTVLEDNNGNSTVEMPDYIAVAVGRGDIKSVLRWINANQAEDRANATSSAKWMSTPLLAVASLGRCLELMTLLLQLGANINTRDCKGLTATRRLFTRSELAKDGVSDRIRLLLSWGASFFHGCECSREDCIREARKYGRPELADLLDSELGGRRCEIFKLSSQPELNGKTCVADEYLPHCNQYKVTLETKRLETKSKEVLVLSPGNLKRRDRTPQDCGYYVEYKNGRTIRHDFDSSEECQAFVMATNGDETQPVVTEEAEARAEQAAAELLAELGLDDSQSKISTGSDHAKRSKKKGGKKKNRK